MKLIIILTWILLTSTAIASAQVVLKCVTHDERERIQGIMREALDQAMKEQTIHLFESWLKDPTGQPDRSIKGMSAALKAYQGARNAVTKWNPPLCDEKQ